MKFFILFALVVQNTCTAILLRYISVSPNGFGITRGTKFLFSTAILFQEIIKILISMGFLLYNQKYYKSQNFINPFIPWREVTKLIVPAALYAIQNCIHYLAPLLLDVPTMQVTYQLKIFTTALFLYVLLGRKLSYKQWSSLFLLASGVCLVHTCAPLEKKTATVPDLAQNKAYGICLVLLACIFSGFATVYYEKILKAQNSDIWIRNIQLGFWSLIFAVVNILIFDLSRVLGKGLLQGYSLVVWATLVANSLGGLIVSVVVKYTDNISKGFATSVSILSSSLLSHIIFKTALSPFFFGGAGLVCAAVFLYSRDVSEVQAPNSASLLKTTSFL